MKVVLDGILINVDIIRKNNKNIYFRFNKDGNLVVTASKSIKDKEILELIQKNEKSLVKMYHRLEIKKEKDLNTWLWGKKYIVVYDYSIKNVYIDGDYIYTKNEKMLEEYFDKEVYEVFNMEANKIKEDFINVPPFTLKIRKMKTRWGVCNYVKKTVTLNYELIKYDKKLLRYVIVHEFAHFTHHDHSKKFWEVVAKYYPQYKEARKELRE